MIRSGLSTPAASLLLRVGVSTRVLFDLEEEHAIFVNKGEDAYCALQREREATLLKPGCAFEITRRLLGLNPPSGENRVVVVLLSRNAPDAALRAFHSCEHYGLAIAGGSFTSGRSVAPFVAAWGVDLFLSNDDYDVRGVVAAGTAAARLEPTRQFASHAASDDVHFVLDGDGVLFGAESDQIFETHGLECFERHERENANIPMAQGPFGHSFLQKLVWLRRICLDEDGSSRVRVSIVTARSAPAHERVIRTLRTWGTLLDEAHFVGHNSKTSFVGAAGACIFFDDREKHVGEASAIVSAGLVPVLQPQ